MRGWLLGKEDGGVGIKQEQAAVPQIHSKLGRVSHNFSHLFLKQHAVHFSIYTRALSNGAEKKKIFFLRETWRILNQIPLAFPKVLVVDVLIPRRADDDPRSPLHIPPNSLFGRPTPGFPKSNNGGRGSDLAVGKVQLCSPLPVSRLLLRKKRV